MKKYILLALLALMGCTQSSSINGDLASSKRNENCMDMQKFQVFHVLENRSALATACTETYDEKFCKGAVVLLKPRMDVDYYDEMYVSAPKGKCATQDGVYKYISKNDIVKTVPVIRFEYEYKASSGEEFLKRIHNELEEGRFECKLSVINKKQNTKTKNKEKNISKDLDKCDCVFDFFGAELIVYLEKNLTDSEKEKFKQEFPKRLEKQCGKIPDYLMD